MAQTVVNDKLALGVEGQFYDTSVKRATPYTLATAAKFGQPMWLDANGNATATYASGLKLLGLLVNPKEHINYGVDGDPLAATLTIPAGRTAAVADIGRVVVKVFTAAKVGDNVYVATTAATDGSIAVGDLVAGTTAAPTVAGATFVQVTGAAIDIVGTEGTTYPQLVVVRLG